MMSSKGGGSFGTLLAFIAGGVVTVGATSLIGSLASRKKKDEAAIVSTSTGTVGAVLPTMQAAMAALALGDEDHVNFLSDILNRLWPFINEAGSALIRESVEPMFAEMMPSALSSLRFTKVDLGSVPIRLDNVVVHEVKDGQVQFDMDVIWDSQSDIQLKADYVGSLGVKCIHMKGRMSFTMKPLTNVLPIVGAIQFAFINPPELELDFTGLANIADFSVGSIDKSIRNMIQDILASMIVLPNRMTSKIDSACDFRTLYHSPIGVARVTCIRGRGFAVEKRTFGKDDVPDVYCKIKLGCEAAWTTSVVKDSLSPQWSNEVHDFLLSDNDQIISIEAWDEDTGTLDADDFLGSAQVTVHDLLLAGKTIEIALQEDKKDNGAFITIHCDVCKFGTDLSSLANSQTNQIAGILTVIITQANDLPVTKKEAASFVKVLHGDKELGVTGSVVDGPGCDALNPVYDIAFRVIIFTEEEAHKPVTLKLMNGPETVLGETKITYADLGKDSNALVERRTLASGASLEFSVSLMGVTTSESSLTKSTYEQASVNSAFPGKESVRVSVLRGHGFKILKKKRFKKADIPDLYVQLKFGSSPTVWTTKTIKDSVAPEWNESKEYAMSSQNQVIAIDVYDANKRGQDDFVGSARVTVGKVLVGGGTMELELQNGATKTGTFVIIRCDKS